MMKKFFSMMLIAASLMAVSCDKDDDNDDVNDNDTYVGTMTIAMSYKDMPISTTQSGVTYLFDEENDLGTVTLSKVKFTTGLAEALPYVFTEDPVMPALDIVLPNIPETANDVYSADKVTPTTLYGVAYGTDTIKEVTNVKVLDLEDAINVTFDCSLALSIGDVDATITFVGAEVE